MTPEERIDTFVGYFQSELANVEEFESHYKRTLLVILLDTLGRVGFPQGSCHKRITGLVEFSGYPYLSHVCLAQLCMALEDKALTDTQLYRFSHRELLRCTRILAATPNQYPLTSLLQMAKNEEVVLATQNTFSELLYTYRNVLVHEFRVPGYGMDFDDTEVDPYTHSYSGRPRQLVFPSGFLMNLCKICLRGLDVYLLAGQSDLTDSFEFGSRGDKTDRKGPTRGVRVSTKPMMSMRHEG